MQQERFGTRYHKKCPYPCGNEFGTDSKNVIYCSQKCYRTAEEEKTKEASRKYCQRKDVKEKRKEYNKRSYLKNKNAELASKISGYFTLLHEKGVESSVLSQKLKRKRTK